MRRAGFLHSGFTLLELLIVMAISCALLSTAIPGFADLMLRGTRVATANELMTLVQLARSEASRRATAVHVCGLSAAGAGCAPAGVSWREAVAYIDLNGNRRFEAGDALLWTSGSLPAALDVTANRDHLVLRPFGAIGVGGTIRICHPQRRIEGRAVVLRLNGRARLTASCAA